MQQAQLMAHCGSSKDHAGGIESDSDTEGSATHQPLPPLRDCRGAGRNLELPADLSCAGGICGFRRRHEDVWVLDLETTFDGCRFSIGVRNSNDKSMRLALTVGYRVFVCDNMAFQGDFTPVLAKHTKRVNLVDILSIGVDRMPAELRTHAEAKSRHGSNRVSTTKRRS